MSGGLQGLPPPMCSFQKLELGGEGHLHSGPGHSAEVLHHVISFLAGVVSLRYTNSTPENTGLLSYRECRSRYGFERGAVGYTVCLRVCVHLDVGQEFEGLLCVAVCF